MAENYWGELPEYQKIRAPSSHLKEQASILQDITKGALVADLAQTGDGGRFNFVLRILVPSLGKYRVNVLSVSHGILSYPCIFTDYVSGTGAYECSGENEYVERLKKVLGSNEVRKIVSDLLSQVHAIKE